MALDPTIPDYLNYPAFLQLVVPPWLAGPYGTLWNQGIGSALDDEWQLAKEAAKVGFPQFTPSDGLTPLGSERLLERIFPSTNLPGETEPEYRTRLQNVWGAWGAPLPPGSALGAPDAVPEVQRYSLPMGIWEAAGSPAIHRPGLFTANSTMSGWPAWLGLTSTRVYRQHEWSTPPFLIGPTFFAWENRWATFWVLIRQPHPFTVINWGDPGLLWGAPHTWGTSATIDEVALIKRMVLTFKSQHSSCAGIVLQFGLGLFWGDGVWGTGVWGHFGFGRIIWPLGEPHWYV